MTVPHASGSLAIELKDLARLRQSAQQNSPEALRGAAKQFEALFIGMLMKSMRDTTPQDGMFDSQQTKMYTGMLDQQLSQSMASRGIGLADVLLRQLEQRAPGHIELKAQDAEPALRSLPRHLPFDPAAEQPGAAAVAAPAGPLAGGPPAEEARGTARTRTFLERLAGHAEEASRSTGIPARFMLGQAALESGWGQREVAGADGSRSHNLFGIKAGAGWKGRVVESATTEYVDGVPQKRVEKFRAYDSYADSFRDYAALLQGNPRYRQVLENAQTASGFANALQRSGYASDPDYANKLIRLIERSPS